MAEGSGDDSVNKMANSLATRLNVDAPVFVPNFGPSPTAPVANNTHLTTTNNQDHPEANNHIETDQLVDTPSDPTSEEVDDWEKRADDEDETAMDEDEEELATDDQGPSQPAKPRKRTKKISVTVDGKDHWNIVFIGHVDAGKSTIGGQILNLTGMVDKRTLEKYEREAKEKNRESWYLSWALDTNQEERDKGKTVEVGRAFFTTENKHFTLLDAPGWYNTLSQHQNNLSSSFFFTFRPQGVRP